MTLVSKIILTAAHWNYSSSPVITYLTSKSLITDTLPHGQVVFDKKMSFTTTFFRRFSTTSAAKPKICIIGSGPAGFYAAQHISSRLNPSEIDIYEKLPVPFGLVRFGVAPDHANLKKCINQFTKTAELPQIRYFGNVHLGRDVLVKELREAYHVVLLAYGVDDSKKLNIKGGDSRNIIQAKNFVGWYNGVPCDKNFPVDLSNPKVTVLGHGNVAIDVARLLLKPVDQLKTTDITEHALAALASSQVKEVHLLGRRGPLQVSFTTKELRELLNLDNCCNIWCEEDLKDIPEIIPQLVRPRKRLTELIVETFQNRRDPKKDDKLLKLIFCRTPKEFIEGDNFEGIKLGINKLVGDDLLNKKAELTDQEEVLKTDLVISSLGYKSVQVDDDVPFDLDRGIVKNVRGKIDTGFYTAGWLSTGPTGVLLNTMQNAFLTGALILKDIETEALTEQSKPGFEAVKNILDKRNVQVVTWKDWLKIDSFEKAQGEKNNKPREKVLSIEEMLEIAAS